MISKVFYHGVDLDGMCSAAIYRYYNPERRNDIVFYYPVSYEDDLSSYVNNITNVDHVIMLDFSLPREAMEEIKRRCGRFIWIDHHKTAIEKMAGCFIEGARDVNKAACVLTWEYFMPDTPLPLAVKLLGMYDIWDFSDHRVLPFQYAMLSYDLDPSDVHTAWVWKKLFEDDDGYIVEEFVENGEKIINFKTQEDSRYFKRFSFPGEFEGYRARFMNRGYTGSFAFFDKGDYDLCVGFVFDGLNWIVSLYSDNPLIDCSSIAKRYGGGGHRGAAGFVCRELPFRFQSDED